ncbi:unnamed protein product [Clonostachys rosea f. rosea IK726]|uniref:Uncharacterized protein n=1 Tax=Clonostachys rosea f. rosea IK726 TaxID=1349383 RepID=A0ACA9U3E2_BIOOC|nr:unnamed protein product [Clonostachys rosea f. rosea IK726]
MPDHPPEVRRRHTALSAADNPARSILRRLTLASNAGSHTPQSHATIQELYPTYNGLLTWEDLGGYLESIWPGWKADKANMHKVTTARPNPLPKMQYEAHFTDDRKKIADLRDCKPLARRSSKSDDEY